MGIGLYNFTGVILFTQVMYFMVPYAYYYEFIVEIKHQT